MNHLWLLVPAIVLMIHAVYNGCLAVSHYDQEIRVFAAIFSAVEIVGEYIICLYIAVRG